MTRKVFLDTNVLVDWLTGREPFADLADKIFELHLDHGFDIFISALSLANVAYLLDRKKVKPHSAISELLRWTRTIDLTRSIITEATESGFADFEDGLQYFSAKSIYGVDVIVTRNKKDFKLSSIPVQSPDEFIASFSK